MCLAEVRQDEEEDGPNANEEASDEKSDLPLGDIHTPQERPIATVGLRNKVRYIRIARYYVRQRTPLNQ
jgi:hypothetical protein